LANGCRPRCPHHQQQHHDQQQRRSVWNESLGRSEALRAGSFYGNAAVEAYAGEPLAPLSLRRLVDGGRAAALDAGAVLANASEVRLDGCSVGGVGKGLG
jgi:hypothetical protein